MKHLVLFLLLGIWGGGCVSAPQMPPWAGRNWQEKQVFYFSGISSGCTNVACAQAEAYHNASASIAAFLGTTVSLETEGMLDNNGQYLQVHFYSATREVPLRHIQVEQFTVSRARQQVTGYVLVSVRQSEIQAALAQIQQEAEQQKKQRQQRRRLGVISVHAPRHWNDFAGQMNQFLSQAGYVTGTNGRGLFVQVEAFACDSSRLQDIQICALQAKVRFGPREFVYSAKGYGRTLAQARQEAIRALVGQIPQDILEGK